MVAAGEEKAAALEALLCAGSDVGAVAPTGEEKHGGVLVDLLPRRWAAIRGVAAGCGAATAGGEGGCPSRKRGGCGEEMVVRLLLVGSRRWREERIGLGFVN